ncbi:MAG: ribonuclease HII [Candidatus Dadabacteria bacterium]|nr:MAG: ribonuclease HII [Candidatus Dadabacteria bacterium]
MARLIAGVDEVGRGPLAGPVVAAAVVFKEGYSNPDIKDSKKLSKKKRKELVSIIKRDATQWAVVAVGPRRIEALNIREASRLAMALALKRVKADLALIDGNVSIDTDIPQETIIGGDSLRVEISAASILAKVWRDDLMKVLDAKYPGYNLGKHAGYPTREHRKAVSEIGPSKVHRKTFRGVREYLAASGKTA